MTTTMYRELTYKIARYITELQAARYMLLENKSKEEILEITKLDIDILDKQLENF